MAMRWRVLQNSADALNFASRRIVFIW